MELLESLNENQRRAVTRRGSPLLILAGPGSGKTRVIAHRIAYLIQARDIAPEHILAVTFTRKAAEELHTRVEQLLAERMEGIWINTFHATCLRLLREHGAAVGLPEQFVIFGQAEQDEVINLALDELGWSRYATPGDLRDLRAYLEECKARGFLPEETSGKDARERAFVQVGEVYQDLLRSYHAVDYNDLILYTIKLLKQEDLILAEVHQRFEHLLVDEFHDVNPAQYRLLQLLAPRDREVTVVADEYQSIYGWRGANPELVARFHRDYNPVTIQLEENYRSTPQILEAAEKLLSKEIQPSPERHARALNRFPMRAINPDGAPVATLFFSELADEQQWLVETIQHLVTAENYRYSDIAVLYRTHQLGDAVEQALRRANIPSQRTQRDSFWEHDGVREVTRYLQLLHSFSDPVLKEAINFPRVIADELTMLQLHELARRDGTSLTDLARQLDFYPEVSPLTRVAVRQFIAAVDYISRSITGAAARRVVENLFGVLDSRRGPYQSEEIETLLGFTEFLSPSAEIAPLRAAVDGGTPITLVPAPTIDAICAAIILEYTLRTYLDAEVRIIPFVGANFVPADEDNFVVALNVDIAADLTLKPRDAGTIRYSLTTVAWRLAQGLVISYETLEQNRFIVYDLETTGTAVKKDEIVEIGALTLDRGAEVGERFETLVRPRGGRIPQAASEVHGIFWEDVRDKPEIEAILPQFLRYIGGAILVGHNIIKFDNVILNREMKHVLKRRLTNPSLDTLEMARRLLPHQRHTLEALAQHFELSDETRHRAAADVRTIRDLFFALLRENRRRKELESLTELLPLVALGMYDADVPLKDENESLELAAARIAQWRDDIPLADRVLELLSDENWWNASRWMARLVEMELPVSLTDAKWYDLKRAWLEQLDTFERISDDTSLDAFLGYVKLATSADDLAEGINQVSLMTLHNSKGKEFPVVVIIGLEEGNLPYWLSLDNPTQLEEERRVLYVGMTRAKERLYLSVTRERGKWARNPSRFVSELPADYVVHEYRY